MSPPSVACPETVSPSDNAWVDWAKATAGPTTTAARAKTTGRRVLESMARTIDERHPHAPAEFKSAPRGLKPQGSCPQARPAARSPKPPLRQQPLHLVHDPVHFADRQIERRVRRHVHAGIA